ncbi:methyl jasmonate esterase 1-like [Magnolia sinica]|uniref:methyl jasmonate esterase 1-like n=1 Tax=Magnolia sinica TaxID=86752 RepID=UPI00265983C2|nr:methyl jasmonate esterase 1-like [Magnolia sinica]
MENMTKKNFILVHGVCHGAWCWYKLATLLRSVGHRVTVLDLAGCGVNTTQLDELHTIDDYVKPLMETMALVPPQEKVVLVGHSFGGFGLSLTMERFPEKISVAIFISALMPGLANPPASLMEENLKRNPLDSLSDSKMFFDKGEDKLPTSFIYGPKYLASHLYQCCQHEDLTLATMLMRPARLYIEDLSKGGILSNENYGTVNRVYIICKEDLVFKEEFQRWIIENYPPREVKEIDDSDHMVMLSKPQELHKCLLEIVEKYA